MKMPGRSPGNTSAFVNAIIPAIMPMDNKVNKAPEIPGMGHAGCQSAYCGDRARSPWE